VRSVSDLNLANDPFCARGNDLAVHLAYAKEFDDAGAAFVNKRFKSQQALAKAQGASAAGSPPAPAEAPLAAPPTPAAAAPPSAPPPPAAATLVRPGIKSQVVNSTAAAVSVGVSKAVGKPWAFAMKTVSKSSDEMAKRRERVPGPAASEQWEMAKKLLLEKMGGATV
jgi:hypothetical protein